MTDKQTICKCGNKEHKPVRFGAVWGVEIYVCPNDIITAKEE
mgnify:CR=1 FL=1